MDLKEEIIALLKKAKEVDNYQNPYFVQQIIGALSEIWGYEDAEIEKWANDLWSY